MRDSADRDLQQWVSGLGLRDASSPWNWVEISFIDNWLLQTLSSQLTATLAAKVPPHRHPLYLVSYATPPPSRPRLPVTPPSRRYGDAAISQAVLAMPNKFSAYVSAPVLFTRFAY